MGYCSIVDPPCAPGSNNGLAPPNPENVIDYVLQGVRLVHVQNVGCDARVEDPCPMPWGDPTSVALVTSGRVPGSLFAYETSTITMSGGSVNGGFYYADGGALRAFDFSAVTLSGGSVPNLLAYDSYAVTMTGGSVGGVAAAFLPLDILMIIGTDFAVDGVPVDYGPIAATSGRLIGTLASGEPIDTDFCHMSVECAAAPFFALPASGLITLVPEPDAARLSCLASLALAVQRRMRAAR